MIMNHITIMELTPTGAHRRIYHPFSPATVSYLVTLKKNGAND